MSVSPEAFRRQVEHFHTNGYEAFTFERCERLRREGSLPERAVVFTFDDAFASVLDAAAILDEVSWPGTVFVVTNFADQKRDLEWFGLHGAGRGLQWDELRALSSRGWEIGSHTCSHRLLSELDPVARRTELTESRKRILNEVGGCATLAYPYGRADDAIAADVAGAGYLAACTLKGAQAEDHPFLRPRVRLASDDGGFRIQLKVSRPAFQLRRSRLALRIARFRRPRPWLPTPGDSWPE